MPIYEYRCEACGHQLEAIQRMSDAPLTDCPECAQPKLTKLVSAAAFRLKGGGWYETDFKKGGKKNLHDSAAKPNAKGKGKEKQDKPPAKTSGKGTTNGCKAAS